jgi:hypothetical protein
MGYYEGNLENGVLTSFYGAFSKRDGRVCKGQRHSLSRNALSDGAKYKEAVELKTEVIMEFLATQVEKSLSPVDDIKDTTKMTWPFGDWYEEEWS